ARGRLVVWWPQDAKETPASLEDIVKPVFKRIAIAKPDLAPYGAAAKESMEAVGIWPKVEAKIVYGENVNAAYQYAKTGNVELVFIPFSLVKPGEKFITVDEKLHKPIDQALCIIKQSKHPELAKKFDDFLKGEKGRTMLEHFGYTIP
ncbi:MAG: molybdate ABC transporter substrate-binding protein, partial [Acidobacteriota bacterium]